MQLVDPRPRSASRTLEVVLTDAFSPVTVTDLIVTGASYTDKSPNGLCAHNPAKGIDKIRPFPQTIKSS